MRRMSVVIAGIVFAGLPALGGAADWPQFRGPSASGVSPEAQAPTEWSVDKNVKWKIEVPGVAWSCPIVWGDKVFVTTAITDKQEKPKPFTFGGPPGGGPGGGPGDGPGGPPPDGDAPPRPRPGGRPPGGPGGPGGGFGMGGGKPPDAVYRWEVHCLDRATGKTLWKQVAAEKKPTIAKFPSNSYASETPSTDGERVYAYFGMTGLYCYDLAGKLVWNKDLGSYKMTNGFGTGSSPTLDGDRLFVQCDNEEKSFLVALDKRTGKELWKVDRAEKSSWSTPFVWKTKERTELVCLGGKKVTSYDPATGKVLWEGKGLGGASASPVADEEMIYFGTSGPMSNGPLYAVKAGASGDITLKEGETSNAGVAWYRTGSGPNTLSPLLYKGLLYVPGARGVLTTYDAATGKQVYKERLAGGKGVTSSPWAADGKVYVLDEDGTTFVVEAGPTFKLLATNKVGEMCWSTPALAGGELYLRGAEHLYCIK